MAGRSSIERLPPAILAAVHEAIVEGATIDEIVRRIRERGGTCSRSAVVRYVKRVRARLRRWREDKALADVRPDTPGARGEGGTGPLTLETLRSLAMRAAIALDDREEPPTVDEIAALALALQRIQGAGRNGADRENAAGREDAGRKETAQGGGLSPSTVARIRAAVESPWARRPGPP